jgi:hypothetical protein
VAHSYFFARVGICCAHKNPHPSQKKARMGHPRRRKFTFGLSPLRVGMSKTAGAAQPNLRGARRRLAPLYVVYFGELPGRGDKK